MEKGRIEDEIKVLVKKLHNIILDLIETILNYFKSIFRSLQNKLEAI